MIEQDILSQEVAARSLSIAIREAIIRSTKDGLQGHHVIRMLEEILGSENLLKTSRDSFARMRA